MQLYGSHISRCNADSESFSHAPVHTNKIIVRSFIISGLRYFEKAHAHVAHLLSRDVSSVVHVDKA